jgi:hypothetical protein
MFVWQLEAEQNERELAEVDLASTRALLREACAEVGASEREVVHSSLEHAIVMSEQSQEADRRAATVQEQLAKDSAFRDLLRIWQANALQTMMNERASLIALLKGTPTSHHGRRTIS